jgi:hypothetical protein
VGLEVLPLEVRRAGQNVEPGHGAGVDMLVAVIGVDAEAHLTALIDRLGYRCGIERLVECSVQLARVRGREILAAGLLRQAGNLPAFARRQAEADHVGGEVHPVTLQLAAQRTRVCVAGLDAVGDENDGGCALGVLHGFRRHANGLGERRLALGLQAAGDTSEFCARFVHGPWRHHHFDVAALALLAVAIGDHAHVIAALDAGQHVAQHLAGCLDLGLAANVAPHGT